MGDRSISLKQLRADGERVVRGWGTRQVYPTLRESTAETHDIRRVAAIAASQIATAHSVLEAVKRGDWASVASIAMRGECEIRELQIAPPESLPAWPPKE